MSTTITRPSEELPMEVIDGILVRLPAKSLMRFKSVSKQWLSLITSHRFALRHHSLAKGPNFFLFLPTHDKNSITPLSFALDGSVRIHLSISLPLSEGSQRSSPVLISAGFGIYCVFRKYEGAFQLWNPATRVYISFPPPPRGYETYLSFYFGKVDFKDGVFSYKVGLVTSTVNDLGGFGEGFSQSIELYSSETKTWKVIPNVYNDEIYFTADGSCVNLNGKAHWFTHCQTWDGNITNITTFDYENEGLDWISIRLAPEVGEYDLNKGVLSLWDEAFLCLVLCWEKDDSLFVDIWVMREYGVDDSWSKEFTVGPISKDAKVLSFFSNVRGILLQVGGSSSKSLMLYDCKSSNAKEFSLPIEYNGPKLELLIKENVESVVSILV